LPLVAKLLFHTQASKQQSILYQLDALVFWAQVIESAKPQ
jgi:hypothetical protein